MFLCIFQYRYSVGTERCLIVLGILFAISSGMCTPIRMIIFGTLLGNMIEQGAIMRKATESGNETQFQEAANKLMDYSSQFAQNNACVGVAIFVFSYCGISLFSYAAVRQVNIQLFFIFVFLIVE